MANKASEQNEWDILYQALREVCAKYGVENPYGDGDYWIVDDNWGSATQKLIVFSPKFLKPALVAEISQCIAHTRLLGAQVIVALDFKGTVEKLPPMGLIVDSCGATEQWDIDLIRRRVGEDFYTEPKSD